MQGQGAKVNKVARWFSYNYTLMNRNLDMADVKTCIEIRVNLRVPRKITYERLFNINWTLYFTKHTQPVEQSYTQKFDKLWKKNHIS